MMRTRSARLASAVVLLLCTSASAAVSTTSSGPSTAVATTQALLLRSSAWVAPVQVLVAAAPAASTTVAALPPVPVTLSQSGIPARALIAYRAAADRVAAAPSSCRITWPLLAAIGFVESGHGSVHDGAVGADGRVSPPILGPRLDGSGAYALIRDSDGGRLDGDSTLDRAVGPMQFIPSTWARHGADGDGTGTADPHDLDDAALAAARYLCHTSRRLDRPAGVIAAVFSYNHSYDYVRVVLTAAARYAGQSPSRWGVGLLPAASPLAVGEAPASEAQVEVLPEPAPTDPYSLPSGDPSPQSQPSPEQEPASQEPAGEPSPQGEPAPQSEPSPQDEPTPEEEPSPQDEPPPQDEEPGPTPAPGD